MCIYPQKQGGPVIPPGAGFPISSSPTIRSDTVEVFEPASTRQLLSLPATLFWFQPSCYNMIYTPDTVAEPV
jgi:hypothetical protein